jgi:hypothetical protein
LDGLFQLTTPAARSPRICRKAAGCRDQRCGQAVAGIVRLDQSRVETGHPDDLQDRAEQFRIGPVLDGRHIDYRGRQERLLIAWAVEMLDRAPALDDQVEESLPAAGSAA